MKENIQIALLAFLSVLMVYDVFIKDDGPTSARQRAMADRSSNITKTPVNNNFAANNAQPQQAKPQPATPPKPATEMKFTAMSHDFGQINQDTENTHVFEFVNNGENPLIIENAKGSCGCTVPEYPRNPIAPGEKGEIKVVYKPGKQKGKQNKTVTITANTEPKTTRLSISADVQEG